MSFGSGGGGNRAPLGEINVTPMVDVMLVLLIIFMVAAPMMSTGVPVDLPDAHAPRMELDEEKLLLSITKEQKVYLGETEVPFENLEEALRTNARLAADHELYVQADESVPYGFVVRVFAAAREAGVTTLGLVTDPAVGGASAPVTPLTPVGSEAE
jgi:biopolymer transport protein TolR